MSTTKTKAKPATEPATAKRQTLWDIGADQMALNALIDECGGDVSDPRVEAAFDAMFAEMQTNEAEKLEGYAQAIRMLEGEAAVAKAEADQFTMKARARENQVRRMRERVKLYLEMQGRTEAVTAKGRKFAIQKTGGNAPLIIDEGVTPDDPRINEAYVKVTKEFDRDAIRKAFAAGLQPPFARLGERGTHLVLK